MRASATGSLPVVGVRDVRAAAEKAWITKPRPERVLLVRAVPEWDTEPSVQVGDGMHVRVGTAVSPLAVLDLLATYPDDRLVVLTSLLERDLGPDLLSRCVGQQVWAPDEWESVRLAFGVTRPDAIDATLVREGTVLAQALLDRQPSAGWPRPTSGLLTREHALRSLAHELLGTPRDLDAAGLLDWTRDPRGSIALSELEAPLRVILLRWMEQRCGSGTRPVLELAAVGEGTDAVPLGLVAHLAWTAAGGGYAKGVLDARLSSRLSEVEALKWGELATAWVLRRLGTDHSDALEVLRAADEHATQAGLADAVRTSPVLLSGLRARLQATAALLTPAAQGNDPRAASALEDAWTQVGRHHLADGDPSAEAVAMAVRLVRWLRTEPAGHQHLQGSLEWHVRTGGWVDRARQVVANGVEDALVGQALSAVHEAASAARRDIDAVAAQQLAQAVSQDEPTGRAVPVEQALSRLVVPLARSERVLLLVLDGMSSAVATELLESATVLGWVEQQRDTSDGREVLLAGLPTLTKVSRTSLLSGRLQSGGQRQERAGLTDVLGDSAALFHLADLQARAGWDLPDEVREAVQDAGRPVVAAVLNAVDDALSGGDPARTRWTVDAVRHLRELMERARAAGRVVVLTSDHGHVVDQGPDSDVVYQRSGAGARWRTPGGEVRDDEVRLTGRRVLEGDGDVVAAVGERLRYKQRSEGYHGGAALAEIAIPFIVLARRGHPVGGYQPVGSAEPTWWSRPVETDWSADPEEDTLFSG